MQNQEFRSATRIAIVAPIWLQNVLSLWLQVVGKFKIITCTTTFEVLPFLLSDISSDAKAVSTILLMASELTVAQVRKIKQMWPTTYLLVLADTAQAELREAGVDDVLPKTFCPELLLKGIDEWEASWRGETVVTTEWRLNNFPI